MCKPITPPCFICTEPPPHTSKPCTKPVTKYKLDADRYIGKGCSTENPCQVKIQKCTTQNPCTKPNGHECQCSGHEHKNCKYPIMCFISLDNPVNKTIWVMV